MSHWAELNIDNKVIRVLVGDNNEQDEGKSFMESLGGTWIKTSYNGKIRKNFAGIGMIYDKDRDAFIDNVCHAEAVLDENLCRWICNNESHNGK